MKAVAWPEGFGWNTEQDFISLSPNGRFACLVNSVSEIRMGAYIGRLALLEGPPEKPRVLLQAPSTLMFSPWAQWLGQGRYCVVVAPPLDGTAFMIFDADQRAFARYKLWNRNWADREFVDRDGHCIFRLLLSESRRWEERLVVFDQLGWGPWPILDGSAETRHRWFR